MVWANLIIFAEKFNTKIMVATIERTKRKVMARPRPQAKPQPRYMVGDVELVGDAALLKLAKERRATDEFISGEEFDVLLDNLINETRNREKGLQGYV